MQIGIIGLPNVGKSTLFQILTKKQVDISAYPFCTIDPNVGIVGVPDQRLKKLAQLTPRAQILPAQIEFVDIAGLVKNAHKGEGLGNQFLAHIREVDALVHIVRGFFNPNISHIEKGVNPKRDIKIVNTELILADLATVEKRKEKIKKQAKGSNQEITKELLLLEKLEKILQKGKIIGEHKFNLTERKILKNLFLLTQKPTIYLLNIDEKESVKKPPEIDITLPLKLELEISELTKEEQKEYRKALKIPQSGINTLIALTYKLLNLITFYTIKGGKETQAWPVRKKTNVLKAAGKIHTDFQTGFIKSQVIPWSKLIAAGSWIKAQEKGLIQTRGKDYLVQDGDVIEFKYKKES